MRYRTEGNSMKRLLLCLCVLLPMKVAAQDSINPYNLGQHCNIILENTDAYYAPFDPPADTDTRDQLSCLARELRSYNGDLKDLYLPRTHGTDLDKWAPHGDTIGPYRLWMRLFTATRKPDGSPSNIVATHVTISSNEDVD